MIMLAYGKYGTMPPFDNLLEDWGHGGLRKCFFLYVHLGCIKGGNSNFETFLSELVKMDISKIK